MSNLEKASLVKIGRAKPLLSRALLKAALGEPRPPAPGYFFFVPVRDGGPSDARKAVTDR